MPIGYIYLIYNEINDGLYIGLTSRTIEKRFKEHKIEARNYNSIKLYENMRKIDIDYWKIKELEKLEYFDYDYDKFKKELKILEDKWIERIKPTLNSKISKNKKLIELNQKEYDFDDNYNDNDNDNDIIKFNKDIEINKLEIDDIIILKKSFSNKNFIYKINKIDKNINYQYNKFHLNRIYMINNNHYKIDNFDNIIKYNDFRIEFKIKIKKLIR